MLNSAEQIFSFDAPPPTATELAETSPLAQTPAMASDDNLNRALAAAGEAAYFWDIKTDVITWSHNTADVLGCPPSLITTGKIFANLLDVDNLTSRYDAVMNTTARDLGEGVPFQIEYVFKGQGRHHAATARVEDMGRWFAGLMVCPPKSMARCGALKNAIPRINI